MRELQNPHLAFRTSTRFADSSSLEVLIANDWDGSIATITAASWQPFTAQLAQNENEAHLWIDSGDVSVKEFEQFYLAFGYTGSGKTANDGTYEVDDIRVYEKIE